MSQCIVAGSVIFGLLLSGARLALADGFTFTRIDVPGASGTAASGINDNGQIVGSTNDTNHGFLDTGGNFTAIDVPGARFTAASGINASGQIVGYFVDANGHFHGFLDIGGSFTPIDVPGASGTEASGINASGQIVGYFVDPNGNYHGFLDTGGSLTPIDVPHSFGPGTGALGINASGQIVGFFFDANGNAQGFLDTGGSFIQISVPGAVDTFANEINANGQIVGSFDDGNGHHQGFLYTAGSFTPINVPDAGASGTKAGGINASGQIVGGFFDAAGVQHGFLATPTPAAGQYLQLNLVSSTPGKALHTDPNLVVPWGIAASATSPWWVANFGSGTSTLYNGFGRAIPLVVAVPPAASSTPPGTPTGIVFNSTSDFVVSQGGVAGPARFIFATLDGTISGWSPGVNPTNAVVALDNSSYGATYTGLATGSNVSGNFLFAANYGTGTVDVIDKSFTQVGSFTDPGAPAGFAPFGIQNINGKLYVTFAPQQFQLALGAGFVDVFDTTGALLKRLVTTGPLFGPWGLALAPANFRVFSNMLLVGNLGDGHINAFDPNSGAFVGQLTDRKGNIVSIPALWGIGFGNDHGSGRANVLYFVSGTGMFGAIYPRGVRLH